mmetsp:Transcript_10829/g.46901  ORF Transcript_10829/g.46901 Transcript_10829/m.46901 type:complete len:312 (-) Transcript_10829:55-990(-)
MDRSMLRVPRDAHRRHQDVRRRVFRELHRPAVHPRGEEGDAPAGHARPRRVRQRERRQARRRHRGLLAHRVGSRRPGSGDTGDERERRPAPVGTSGASRAADGGREARQVRLADRAVRGRARVRVPPQAQIVGARRGSVVPPLGVYHPTATPGGGGRLGPRRAPRASSRRRESGGGHGTLRASQRRRPRAPPRDWAPPRVPPRGGGHAGIAGGVPGVAEGVLEAPRRGGSRGPRARAAPGDVHVAARAPLRGRGYWGRGGKRRWVGGYRGWGFEEEGAARGDCVAGARHEQGVAAARGRGQRAPRGGEEEE